MQDQIKMWEKQMQNLNPNIAECEIAFPKEVKKYREKDFTDEEIVKKTKEYLDGPLQHKIKTLKYHRYELDEYRYDMPHRFLNSGFDNYDVGENTKAFEYMNSITTQWRGSVYLYGSVGCGKTHLACALYKEWLWNKKAESIFTTSSRLLYNYKKSFNQDYGSDGIDRYLKSDLLVIDDFGTEKVSDFVIETWQLIVDYRYADERPTIYTSNLSMAEIAKRMGDRIASRLSSGKVFKLTGKDYRLKK